MGKDKKAKAPVTLGAGGLAGAIGAYSSSPATGPSLLSAVLGDSSLDGEAQVLLKKLGKRDTTTKLKALVELHATLKDKGAEWAVELLPHWCLAFGRLATDISWQVREQACSALGVVAALVGRQLAPQLRTLMPPWLCCKCDVQHDVRRAAAAAFTTAFPSAEKGGSALLYCREELVSGLVERALALAPPKVSDKEEAAEAAEIHERSVASALGALARLLRGVPEQGRAQLAPLLETPLPRLWPLASSQAATVRAAVYGLGLALLQTQPAVASAELGGLGGALLEGLSDKDPLCHAALWEPLLLLLRTHSTALREATPTSLSP